ncbi:MAG: hypothetical protein LQ351_001947 [Letrouitia transgressa]|nr:MAG: hypothetical protein LQ351_001947 [Letrouitia transgressa]
MPAVWALALLFLSFQIPTIEAIVIGRSPQTLTQQSAAQANVTDPAPLLSNGFPSVLPDDTPVVEGQQTQQMNGWLYANGRFVASSPVCKVSIWCKDTAKFDIVNIFRGRILDIAAQAHYAYGDDIACHVTSTFKATFEYCLFGQGQHFPAEGVDRDEAENALRILNAEQQYACGCIALAPSGDLGEDGFLKIDYVNHAECEGACAPTCPEGPCLNIGNAQASSALPRGPTSQAVAALPAQSLPAVVAPFDIE